MKIHVLHQPQERERNDDDVVEVSRANAFVVVNETKVKVDLTKYMEKHQVRRSSNKLAQKG